MTRKEKVRNLIFNRMEAFESEHQEQLAIHPSYTSGAAPRISTPTLIKKTINKMAEPMPKTLLKQEIQSSLSSRTPTLISKLIGR